MASMTASKESRLGLQILVVTPLQKIHVIEPYVKAIGFVDNPSGTFSRMQTMTIEEYRDRRDGRIAATPRDRSSQQLDER